MAPNTRLVIALAVLIFALLFFFLGQSIIDAPGDLPDATPTPSARALFVAPAAG